MVLPSQNIFLTNFHVKARMHLCEMVSGGVSAEWHANFETIFNSKPNPMPNPVWPDLVKSFTFGKFLSIFKNIW